MKLTPAQWAMLDEICKTNGGGISGHQLNKPRMWSLHKRGLIQGKSSELSTVVHTREGLELWRKWKSEQNGGGAEDIKQKDVA